MPLFLLNIPLIFVWLNTYSIIYFTWELYEEKKFCINRYSIRV